MEIVPAILESSAEEFKESLEKVVSFAKRIQVDFNDGSFEGFTSVRPEDIAAAVMPYVDKIEFEAHLMVQKPQDYIPKLKELGFKKVILQFETAADLRAVFEELQKDDFLVGLAIAPETSVLDIEPFADFLDTITVMDIDPGKQGQKFLPQELEKIRELRQGFGAEVQADGAVSQETIVEIAEADPDTLVVGSAIVKSSDPHEAYESLLRLIS